MSHRRPSDMARAGPPHSCDGCVSIRTALQRNASRPPTRRVISDRFRLLRLVSTIREPPILRCGPCFILASAGSRVRLRQSGGGKPPAVAAVLTLELIIVDRLISSEAGVPDGTAAAWT